MVMARLEDEYIAGTVCKSGMCQVQEGEGI